MGKRALTLGGTCTGEHGMKFLNFKILKTSFNFYPLYLIGIGTGKKLLLEEMVGRVGIGKSKLSSKFDH